MTVDTLVGIWNVGVLATQTVAIVAALGFYYKQARAATDQVLAATEQARAAKMEHLNNVHQLIFERLDASEIRTARHYIYTIDMIPVNGKYEEFPPITEMQFTYQTEHWVELGSPGFNEGNEKSWKLWQEHKDKAEKVARALDQLGYLVREGIVPLNVVARFYSYPTLKCWYKLSPYIKAIRIDRQQFGHMWEWENLVKKIIVGTTDNLGIWHNTSVHDNLGKYAELITKRTGGDDFPRDNSWQPPDRSNYMDEIPNNIS